MRVRRPCKSDKFHQQVTARVKKLSKETREVINSQVKIETRTIEIDGASYTLPVKVCPVLHATGYMGAPFKTTKQKFIGR